ncbi:hypothetical protein ABQF26_42700, partial [Mycolicibacterium elephantis]
KSAHHQRSTPRHITKRWLHWRNSTYGGRACSQMAKYRDEASPEGGFRKIIDVCVDRDEEV